MSTTLTFHQALERAELLARQALPPELHDRLSCGVALVKAGAVFQDDGGLWTVASASTPGKEYSPNGTCDCDDLHFNKPRYCKHQLAAFLSQRVLSLMHQPPAPVVPEVVETSSPPAPQVPQPVELVADAPAAVPLGEAPASVNCHITLAGRQVQLTLRDSDEGRLLRRLEAVLAQYPVPEAQPQGQGKDWCTKHQTTMRWNDGKEGRKGWHSHKTADGWCKGR